MKKKKLFPVNKIKMITGCSLLAAGFLLFLVSRLFRGFSQWYSTHLYQVWVNSLGRAMGAFPFSVIEMVLYVLILVVFFAVFRSIYLLAARKDGKKKIISDLVNFFLLAAVLFFLYIINCGINYNRDSFVESSGLAVGDYSVEELKAVCYQLTEEVNRLAGQVERDGDGVMQAADSTGKDAIKMMKKLGEEYPGLAGYYPQPKGLIFPWILSVQQLSGIYVPFTIEANYNSGMVDYNIPFTTCHELSHLRGFMQEEEANFIAFLACTNSEELSFQYSGYLCGWSYCMNMLYALDYDSWEEVRAELAEPVEADIKANREFWAKYDGTIAEVANQMNHTYLKANGQEDGVQSYSQVADLIVVYYRD